MIREAAGASPVTALIPQELALALCLIISWAGCDRMEVSFVCARAFWTHADENFLLTPG